MKRQWTHIMGIALVALVALLAGANATQSQINLPYPTGALTCEQATLNGMAVLNQEWNKKLNEITSQPKPASELVDDAFESLRTYRCWLDYLCLAVSYSGTVDPSKPDEVAAAVKLSANGLSDKVLGTVPGCQAPQDVGLPSGWQDAWTVVVNTLTDQKNLFAQSNRFTYIPQCSAAGGKNSGVGFTNYQQCLNAVDLVFSGTDPAASPAAKAESARENSTAFLKVVNALKDMNARQSTAALENKLNGIVTRLGTMESRAQTMKADFEKIRALAVCAPQRCD